MIHAIIQARLNSHRFPSKVLAELNGTTVLGCVVDRVRQIQDVDHIVVATHRNGSEAIAGHCEDLGVECFIHDGEENDVLGRFVDYLDQCNAAGVDLVVRVCADSPLLDPLLADELVTWAGETGGDYMGYEIDGHPAVLEPTGLVCEVVTVGALRHADRSLTDDEPMREHVTQIMYRKPVHFHCHWLPMPAWYTGERWAVDRPENLDRIGEEMTHGH